jgi:CheY-like chemotaxis protein
MVKKGPIILIDDDKDEGEILEDVFARYSIPNPLLCFYTGKEALDYLRTTTDKPFLILCDISMPEMNGIEVRKKIHEDEYLRRKSIPFVFYTTSASEQAINAAYEMNVQGFFQKEHDAAQIERLIRSIHEYWTWCRHPNHSHSSDFLR